MGKGQLCSMSSFFSTNMVLAVSKETDKTKGGGKGTYHGCVRHLTALAHSSPT